MQLDRGKTGLSHLPKIISCNCLCSFIVAVVSSVAKITTKITKIFTKITKIFRGPPCRISLLKFIPFAIKIVEVIGKDITHVKAKDSQVIKISSSTIIG